MSVDPAIVVTVVAPARRGIPIIAFTVAPFCGFLALIIAFAVFPSVGIRPGAEFGAIARNTEVLDAEGESVLIQWTW